MIENSKKTEKIILVGVSVDDADINVSLDELAELIKTAGGEVVGRITQNLEAFNSKTYVGSGKIEEIRNLVEYLGATSICCDDELSPVQLRNLSDLLDVKILDRTIVILDIFASRATTREGKIQVELAQMQYRATKLIGLGKQLSRTGGGIGTRGPGEKKLEIDRRRIHDRISFLKKNLEEVEKHRETVRKNRKKNEKKVAAIVGYTNAGKSTLLKTLTNADILSENKLFATLDPTTRNYRLIGNLDILLTDTVGFINKLPHHLVEAFKSTLEEAVYADIIIHVVDVSDEFMDKKMDVVYKTLESLKIVGKPIVTVFNKNDIFEGSVMPHDFRADKMVRISAKTRAGIEKFNDILIEFLRDGKELSSIILPYDKANKVYELKNKFEIVDEKYCEEGIQLKGYFGDLDIGDRPLYSTI